MENGKIYQSMINIMADTEAITKGRTNPQQGYKFRGIDDIYNALHPLFARHGVFVTSEVLSESREERTTQKGGLLLYSILTIKFIFWTVDGSSVSCTTKGEAMDSGDKATNKAMSAALKYALMQMLLIPTEEDKDSEGSSPQPAAKQPQKKEYDPLMSCPDDLAAHFRSAGWSRSEVLGIFTMSGSWDMVRTVGDRLAWIKKDMLNPEVKK